MISLFQQLCTLDFWQALFETFRASGPPVAVALAMLESFIPALPLTAIAVLNVSAYGLAPGFFFTWAGSCLGCTLTFLFFRYGYGFLARRFHKKSDKAERARAWIGGFDFAALFLILCLPFTPSSFMNLAFGVSEYPVKKYLLTLYAAKLVMIGSLALFGNGVLTFWKDPVRLTLCLLFMAILYLLSVKLRRKHHLQK